jgi:voltage-gated potassium channel
VGRSPRELEALVIALVRRGKVVTLTDQAGAVIETGDMLVYVRDDRPQTAAVP